MIAARSSSKPSTNCAARRTARRSCSVRTVQTSLGPFTGFDQDLVTQILSTGQFWDEQIRPYLDQADPTGLAIDLGANIGWFSIYLAQRHPPVIAVEAQHAMWHALFNNIALNQLECRVIPFHLAAYDAVS